MTDRLTGLQSLLGETCLAASCPRKNNTRSRHSTLEDGDITAMLCTGVHRTRQADTRQRAIKVDTHATIAIICAGATDAKVSLHTACGLGTRSSSTTVAKPPHDGGPAATFPKNAGARRGQNMRYLERDALFDSRQSLAVACNTLHNSCVMDEPRAVAPTTP